jgi:hypothetical protein
VIYCLALASKKLGRHVFSEFLGTLADIFALFLTALLPLSRNKRDLKTTLAGAEELHEDP